MWRTIEKYSPVLDSEWLQYDCCNNLQKSFLRASIIACRSPKVNSCPTCTCRITKVYYSVGIHLLKETLMLIENSQISLICDIKIIRSLGKDCPVAPEDIYSMISNHHSPLPLRMDTRDTQVRKAHGWRKHKKWQLSPCLGIISDSHLSEMFEVWTSLEIGRSKIQNPDFKELINMQVASQGPQKQLYFSFN